MVDPLDVIALGQARILVADLTKKCERLQFERDQLRVAVITFLDVFNTTTRRPQPAIDDAAVALHRALWVTDDE